MSKSRGNAIAISATADETARLIARRETDAERRDHLRPGHAGRRCPTSSCSPRSASSARPRTSPPRSGARRSQALKRLVTDAVNERFRDIRARRAELIADPGHLRRVLRDGTARAREIADDTLREVRARMHTDYPAIAPTRPAPPRPRRAAHAARTA